MAPGDTARLYHRLTSYSRWDGEWPQFVDDPRLLQDFEPNVLATFPAPCKAYPAGLPTVAMPRELPASGSSTTAVLAGRDAAAASPNLARLAQVLHLSAGVVPVAERDDGRRYLFRAAGSAGARFPLEVYVAARGVEGLADGIHWFNPPNHALVQIGPPPEGETTTLVLTGIPWRTGWRYSERGYRHIYSDAGTMLAQAIAVADDSGLAPRLRTVFPDSAVTRLVGAEGVHEFPVAIVTLGDGEQAVQPGGEAARGDVDRQPPLEFPLATSVQRAGDADELGDVSPSGDPLAGNPPASPGSMTSSSSAAPHERWIRRPPFRASSTSGRSRLRSAAAGRRTSSRSIVDGVEPGLYRWPDLDTPLGTGNLREELFRVCLDQELGPDASFVVIGAVDAATIDDRGYREAQLGSGLVEGRLHLAAYALGIGATGMTFADSEIAGLLGAPLAALLFTCVGVPTYRTRPGGAPGAPKRSLL